MEKDTNELKRGLGGVKNTSGLLRHIEGNDGEFISGSLAEYLGQLMKEKGVKRSAVVKGSNLSKGYAYDILAGKKTPERKKLIGFAFGLGLNSDETSVMLKRTGYRELYARDKWDSVVIYALDSGSTVHRCNLLLNEVYNGEGYLIE